MGNALWRKTKIFWRRKATRQPVVALLLRELAPFLQLPLGRLAVALVASLLWVMFFTACGGIFAWFLGTNDKNETITYIGLGLGGVLAAMGALALNRRAAAVAEHNELVEKGHVDERLKMAVESLGHAEPSIRIAAFYQFYHLTKGSTDTDFVKNIFDILCAHLRQITSREDYRNKEGSKKPTEECQSLLDVLFKNPQNVFAGMKANLRGVYLFGADFSDANAQGVNLLEANLQNALFSEAKLQKAIFVKANLRNASFSKANLHGAFLVDATLEFARLEEANLHDAWLPLAKARKAFFGNANIEGTVFWRAHMHGVDLSIARNFDKANFSTPMKISASDVKNYPKWFKKGTHYTVSEPE